MDWFLRLTKSRRRTIIAMIDAEIREIETEITLGRAVRSSDALKDTVALMEPLLDKPQTY